MSPKNLPYFLSILIVVCLHVSATAQSMDERNKLATMTAIGSGVRWDVAVPHASVTMTVAAPDGRVFRKEFKAGAVPQFLISTKEGERLPDGTYTYELSLAPSLSTAAHEALLAARGKDDEPEEVRATRKRAMPAPLVQSGAFSILNGTVIVAGAIEEGGRSPVSKVTAPSRINSVQTVAKNPQHHPLMITKPDDVIPDDLIVQGSACVGLDCVNGEVFGFDTIRLKENNTRLQFEDTSAAGFPLNNWQIRANSSAAGGASFLAFVDQGAAGNSETGTIVFEVDAGAPANSVKVASNGKVGLRTATPVLDVHANTSDTPAIRLEQNNSGGFTAQTWDMAGNEANFFVRDVTGGSRLPFRIRPGAPTSSIDIAASGNVGIGSAAPGFPLDVLTTGQSVARFKSTAAANAINVILDSAATRNVNLEYQEDGVNKWFQGNVASDDHWRITNSTANGNAEVFSVLQSGSVGIGTTAPDQKLSVNGDASKVGGGSWQNFSDERLKNIKGQFNLGLNAIMKLQPLRYEYRADNALGLRSEGEHIGFGAQAVQKVIPEAVTKNSQGYMLVNNDPILWTMLNAIKEQQKEIEQLRSEIKQLRVKKVRRVSHRRR